MNVINVSAYKFFTWDPSPAYRDRLRQAGDELGIKGTILLSPEGINVMLAANPDAWESFRELLSERVDLDYKVSHSDFVPFKRFFVKIKPEIITFRQIGVQPEHYTSAHLDPSTLKSWLDEGRDVVILDTRNRFEIEYGKFTQAVDLNIDNFTEFADAIASLPDEIKDKPIVTYCTGGVRCEKAAPLLEAAGCREVYQIDGGILRYFEACGAAHYTGDCFVFDERVSLRPDLTPTNGELT